MKTRASPTGLELRRRAAMFVQPYDAKIETWNLRVGHLEGLLLTRLTDASDRLTIMVELEDIAFHAESLADEIVRTAGELSGTSPVVNAMAALNSIVQRSRRKPRANLNGP